MDLDFGVKLWLELLVGPIISQLEHEDLQHLTTTLHIQDS